MSKVVLSTFVAAVVAGLGGYGLSNYAGAQGSQATQVTNPVPGQIGRPDGGPALGPGVGAAAGGWPVGIDLNGIAWPRPVNGVCLPSSPTRS
jgi:hypothetical protein